MSERYITKVEYKNCSVKVYLDNGDTLGALALVESSKEYSTYSTVKIEAYMVKSE